MSHYTFAKASLIVLLFTNLLVYSQELTSQKKDHKITFNAYADGYLSSYSNDLPQSEFQPFETVGARDNTFGVNVAQFGVHYEHEKVRANITLHWGDIPQATWSSDFNEIQEANVGVKLSEGLWLDAGFFRTHIGTESFLPRDILLSNTAFKTFNEPFYQAGARLSYDKVENWYFEFWALNGYNNFLDNNDAKSVGALATYSFSDKTSITYTNLYGRESEDSAPQRQNRFYNNIYLNQNWNDIWLLTVGFDLGFQTNSELRNSGDTASMYAGLATLRYQFKPKWSMTTRAEVFKDNNGFISGTTINNNGDETGFELYGLSLGSEYKPVPNAYVRLETRYTTAARDLDIFNNDGRLTNTRWEILFTMGLDFEKALGF